MRPVKKPHKQLENSGLKALMITDYDIKRMKNFRAMQIASTKTKVG